MQHLHDPHPGRWHVLRRPSTLVMLCAGLLAADPLRLLPASWMDATLPAGARLSAALVLVVTLLWRMTGRRRHGREVRVLMLPPRAVGGALAPTVTAKIRPTRER